ncbi:hypothetical protein FACS189498_3350 [Spirochaetia bacterium]|nr:hypothetical protein FACS189498_3350 [Spirochaetia bacterium]
MDIYRNLSFYARIFALVLSTIPSINNLVANNSGSGSFYLK